MWKVAVECDKGHQWWHEIPLMDNLKQSLDDIACPDCGCCPTRMSNEIMPEDSNMGDVHWMPIG
jgi:hypothetical protein